MPDVQIHPDLKELLNPIRDDAPVGEDVAKSDDPEASAAYMALEMDLSQLGEINYKECAEKAIDILQRHSKHLRVAAWLALCWLWTEGLTGFKNGLLLLLDMMKNFGDQLFPAKPAQRSKAIQYLNTDKRFQAYLKKLEITPEDTEVLTEIRQILKNLAEESKTQFKDDPPRLDDITGLIDERVKAGPGMATTNNAPAEVVSETGSEKETDTPENSESNAEEESKPDAEPAKVSEKQFVSEGEAMPNSGETPETGKEAVTKESAEPAEETEEKEPEIEISEEVSELLEDIDSDSPTGDDAENSSSQDTMVLYMSLESEINKMSGNDYSQCAKLAAEILQEHSKHLRVAVWLCIAWFRLEKDSEIEKLNAFKNGLILLLELLKKYEDRLHPSSADIRSKAVQALNSDVRFKLLQKIRINEKNAKEFLEIDRVFQKLVAICHIQFPENSPRLKDLAQIIEEQASSAREFLKPREAPKPKPKPETTSGAAPQTASSPTTPATPTKTTVSPGAAASAPVEVNSEKAAKVALKNGILYFFEEETDNKNSRKIPTDMYVYGLSRTLRWGQLNVLPPGTDKVTQIDAPPPAKENYLQKLIANKDFETLIPDIEISFLKNDSFVYWLDVQRYVVQAMEQKGGLDDAIHEIKFQLAKLLKRLPGLETMIFKGTQKAPFANAETISWIRDEVETVIGSGKSGEKILPPVMGEDYAPISEMYEAACEELPDKFEENLKIMQDAIAGESRLKGKFLRMLNLANYCYTAKRYPIAKVLFNQLKEKIDEYQIMEWERALCVSVWQSIYLTNQQLLKTELEPYQVNEIKQEQNTLFERIGKYDSVLALNLLNHIQNKGE